MLPAELEFGAATEAPQSRRSMALSNNSLGNAKWTAPKNQPPSLFGWLILFEGPTPGSIGPWFKTNGTYHFGIGECTTYFRTYFSWLD